MTTRVYLLAHELDLDYQAVLAMAEKKGLKVRSHLNALEPEEETLLRKALEVKPEAPAEAPVEAPKEKPAAEKAPEAPEEPKEEKRPFIPGELVAPAPPKEEKPAAAASSDTARDAGHREGERKGKRRDRRRGRRKLDGAEIIRKLRGSRFFEKETAEEVMSPGPGLARPLRRPTRPLKRRPKRRTGSKSVTTVPPKDATVYVTVPVSVKELSQAMGIKVGEILGVLLQNGVKAHINASLDQEAVELLGVEFDREVEVKQSRGEEQMLEEEKVLFEEDPENLVARPPVVTFLGHVDHGKTSLLDIIKETKVQASEAGGITQHMAAYEVAYKGKTLTFLDTPGHAAFTEMRARGANVTDVVVLVVAADDGVMPQTEEAVNHARAAGVPIVVALNKIDLPNANPMRAKQQLSTLDLLPEEFGGETVVVETSAVQRQGIEDLLDMLLLVSEMQDFRADPSAPATGHVLESRLTEGKGVVATLLVRTGTLRKGDFILAGKATGRVRALEDSGHRPVDEAPPSKPVDILGLDRVPDAGDSFFAAHSEDRAKAIARERITASSTRETRVISADNLYDMISAGKADEVPLIIKADVKGSLEPLRQQLEAFSTGEVKIKVLHAGVGTVTESDVLLAEASRALIIGFHIFLNERVRSLADEHGVEIRVYDVIYQAVDEIKQLVEGKHKPLEQEKVLGHAEVRKVFKLSRGGHVAGCYVRDGLLRRRDFARVLRQGKALMNRVRFHSLKRFTDDVREVKEGFECGVKLTGFDDYREGDIIEAYEIELVQRKLEDVMERD